VDKIAGVAGRRIPLHLLRQDRHRQLGQVLERQVIETAALCEQNGRLQVVPPETATIANAYAFHEAIRAAQDAAGLTAALRIPSARKSAPGPKGRRPSRSRPPSCGCLLAFEAAAAGWP